ncbi:MAG: PQQ-like beta-propeller repeat protein [Acidobacteriia bacterium]|nr:PQQ-like beta-propeller repeat protein [Terriglobia bacterium]
MRTSLEIVASALLLFGSMIEGAGAQVPSPEKSLQPLWELNLGKPIYGIALSSRGSCIAMATDDEVDVRDRTGHPVWEWNFRSMNRYIVAGRMAVSPSCDMVALNGDPGYRYTWIAHRDGRRMSIRSKSTPLGLAISHHDNLVAIGTGGGSLSLYAADGKLRWRRVLMDGAPIGADLSFSEDDKAILVHSISALLSINGDIKWVNWSSNMRAARDLKTFIASREPPHGPGLGLIIALDQNGKELWMKVSSLPEAAISLSGDKIASWVNDNQDPTEEDGYHPDDQEGEFQILSRRGDVLKTLPIEGRPIAFSSDGHHLLIMKPPDLSLFDLEGNPLWRIPVSDRSGVITTGNLKVILVYDRGGQGLSWFEPNN